MFLGSGELQGALTETDGKYSRGEMTLIKVIWCLIGHEEVCRSGEGEGVVFGKMTTQGQQRYEATACTATADNPPSSAGN